LQTTFKVSYKPTVDGSFDEHGTYETLEAALASTHLGSPAEAYTDISNWTEANRNTLVLATHITRQLGRRSPWLIETIEVPETDADRIDLAVLLALECSHYEGDHHKMWVIDQMLRHLLGDKYDETIARYNGDEDDVEDDDDFDRVEWDTGVAP